MENFIPKSIITSPHALTYSYYLSPGFHESLRTDSRTPTLLFLHGFPDHAHMWNGTIKHMGNAPYRMVAVDILGFGGSSKPLNASLYNYRKQASSIAQILSNEGVHDNVIPIGHDWGSATAQRFYLYHQDFCKGLVLISLAYQIPSSEPFDLETANRETTKRFGYPQWEYWNFFTAPGASDLMRENLERFWAVNNGLYPSTVPEEKGRDIWMREMFCTPGAMEDYIAGKGKYANYDVPLKPYAKDQKLREDFIERLSRDGCEGPVNYYHALKDNTSLEDERFLCSMAGDGGKKIRVPLLYIGQTGDWVCRTDLMSDAKRQGLVDDLEEKAVEAGHWVMYETPEEIAALLKDWLARRFPVKT